MLKSERHVRLPNELVAKIIGCLRGSHEELLKLARLNRQWSSVASPELWRRVHLLDDQVPLFVRGLLLSALSDLSLEGLKGKSRNSNAKRKWMDTWDCLQDSLQEACTQAKRRIKDATNRPIVSHVMRASIAIEQVAVDPATNQAIPMPGIPARPEALIEALEALFAHPDVQGGERGPPPFTANELAQLQEMLELIRPMTDEGDLPLFGPEASPPAPDENQQDTSELLQLVEMDYLGWGQTIKSLRLPSDGKYTDLVESIIPLLPNVKVIHIYHPPHDNKTLPRVGKKLLKSIQTLVHRAHTLILEDITKDVWKDVLNLTKIYGSNLRHLDLENLGEVEPFISRFGVFPVLSSSTPNLEYLRLDGLTAGVNRDLTKFVQKCPKVKAITLDYCYGISMGAFATLWNGLEHLEFLGCAGIIGKIPLDFKFNVRRHLKTLRFVDCDVSDEMVCVPFKKRISRNTFDT
jgi:hypothetical protein